jgi:hypothetical protein
MSLTVASLIQEFGAYYESTGQNAKRVLRLLTQPTVTEGFMTPIKTDDTIYKLANSSVSAIVQPFQKTWSPKGTDEFKPVKIEQQHIKADIEMYPDDIEATWAGFLSSKDLTRKDWPLVKWLMEVSHLPRMRSDMENDVIYKGVFVEPESGVAGDAGTSMDGLRKKLVDGVTAGTINLVSGIGALDEATIFDQIEAFIDGISELYQGVPMKVFVAPKYAKAYLRAKRDAGVYQITGPGQIDKSVDFLPFDVEGLPSMSGTTDIFATPKENMIHLTKKDINKNRFNIEESKRQVFLMTDWWEAVGFGINQAVWTNINAGSGSV